MINQRIVIEYTKNGNSFSRVFKADGIKEISPEITTSLSANELVVDNVTVVLDLSLDAARSEAVSFLNDAPYGADVVWEHPNSNFADRYFLKKMTRVSTDQFKLEAVSFVGMLDNVMFDGAIAIGSNHSVSIIINLIMAKAAVNGYVIPFRIDESLSSRKFFGFIPYCTLREALHQVIFTTNTTITRDDDGTIVFFELGIESPGEILPQNIFDAGRYFYSDPIGEIELTAHSYSIDTSLPKEVVFDNTGGSAVTDHLIIADKPMAGFYYEGDITGETVTSSPVAVIVTGQGIVKGLPYKHDELTVRRINYAAPNGKTIRINDVFCITQANFKSVMDRLYNYFALGKSIEMEVKCTSEKCGKRYIFQDVFGDTQSAYLEKMSLSVSSFIRGRLTLIPNYIPPSTGVSTAIMLTGSGVWSVPEDVTEFSAFLVGGGNGGESGLAGGDGASGEQGFLADYQAQGGGNGQGGLGGKILELYVSNAARSYSYSCGVGGSGGSATSSKTTRNAGSACTDTTLGSWSSASGVRTDAGYTDLGGNTYGKKGASGITGGKGGYNAGGMLEWENLARWGESAPGIGGGIGGSNANSDIYYSYPTEYRFFGGNGGGGAFNANGFGGEMLAHSGVNPNLSTGRGGNGASAAAPPNPTKSFGWGGTGGSGGGGGGAGGYATTQSGSSAAQISAYAQSGGIGGNGGAGGRGQDGCILIVY